MMLGDLGFLIKGYDPSMSDEWNRFVASARNATFLFDRGYMGIIPTVSGMPRWSLSATGKSSGFFRPTVSAPLCIPTRG